MKAKNRWFRGMFSSLNREVHAYQQATESLGKPYSRRTFISQSAMSAAALAIAWSVPGFLISCNDPKAPSDPNLLDVAILGGGIAGLNCGNHLLQSKLSFKIFEGSRRIGGRILTHYNDSLGLGIFPEFGGDFIDSDHEDMRTLAKEFNLELLDLIAEQEAQHWIKDVYFFDNRKLSEHEIIREFQKIIPKITHDKESLGTDYDTPDAVILDHMPMSKYIASLSCANWLKELFTAAFIAEYGLDTDEQSTLNMLDLIETDTTDGFKVFGPSDERYRIKGGNSKITEALAEKIGADKIEKNQEVRSVTEQADGTYLIRFNNEKEAYARIVVCTIPFTILRDLELNLKDMPAVKRKCIDELGYGKNTKLILGYDSQPWRSKENNAMGYLFTNDMTNGWDGSATMTENNTNGAYVAFFGGKFSQELSNSSSISPHAPPTHSWRTAIPEEKVNGFVTELDRIFKGSKNHFAGRHVFVNWLDYPYVKASYSCYKPGQWTEIAGQEMTPVGNFYFAGEHCSEQFQGFMNGGAETGRRVAETLINSIASGETKEQAELQNP